MPFKEIEFSLQTPPNLYMFSSHICWSGTSNYTEKLILFSTFSFRRNPDDINSQTEKMGPSTSSVGSARRRRKDQLCSKINKRTLLYKKSLTHDDVSFCSLKIPLESGRKFLPEPNKYNNGVYDKMRISFVDHEGDIWRMEAAFEEPSSSYMIWLNWDRYLMIFELEAPDVIFFYYVPASKHYLIEYKRKERDNNPKDTS